MAEANYTLIPAAAQFVTDIFTQRMGKDFVFHSLEHTKNVVFHSEVMATHYELAEDDRLALVLASWFHDTGYSAGVEKVHEEESQKIATEFLQARGISEEIITKVNKCILATKMPQSPTNLTERIICDADLFHLGTDDFWEMNKNLRQEINHFHDEKISKKDWRRINIEFLQRHRYFTDYAQKYLDPVKQVHLNELMEKEGLKKPEPSTSALNEPAVAVNAVKTETNTDGTEKIKDKEKKNRTERGIVAMFRIMSESHVNLSQMADSKANIMISVNTIVISIMVSVLLGKLQFYPEFIIPTIILVGVCLAAVIFAILATRPNISGGTFTREDITNKKVNLLFFGNFYNMQLQEYDWAMKEMMNDKEYLYGSMIKDMYYLGLVLARKYKFLRISYNIFMYGLVAAIIAFALAFIFGATE